MKISDAVVACTINIACYFVNNVTKFLWCNLTFSLRFSYWCVQVLVRDKMLPCDSLDNKSLSLNNKCTHVIIFQAGNVL